MRAIASKSTALVLMAILLTACGGEAKQAERHDVDVVTDGEALERFATDEGYEVELESVKLRVRSVEFTSGGEAHASQGIRRIFDGLLRSAHAHPNHQAGGEVAGELPGPVVLQWRPGQIEEVGMGRFLEADYAGYNLEFTGASAGDDDLMQQGLMARIEGVFDDGEAESPFVADIEVSDSERVYGGVLQGRIPDDVDDGVALVLLVEDDWAGSTLFDGVRFGRLDTDDDGRARIDADDAPVAHALVRQALRDHGYYDGKVR